MRDGPSQSHVRWYCRYHIVFVPRYRRRVIHGQLRRRIGRIIRELCQQQEVELVEGHAMPDHVHLCLSIPPKYSVANTVGWLKGKSAIWIYRECLGRERNFTGLHCWARCYCVSTVGLDEQVLREYIRNQEQEDKRQEELQLEGLETVAWRQERTLRSFHKGLRALRPFHRSGVSVPSGGLHQPPALRVVHD